MLIYPTFYVVRNFSNSFIYLVPFTTHLGDSKSSIETNVGFVSVRNEINLENFLCCLP